MSLKETLSLAHTAQCKLHIAANRPDRNLRFVLGHALTLDNLTLRLVEIEEEQAAVSQPQHASGIKFKAAGNAGGVRRRSPPPSRLAQAVEPDDEDEDDDVEDDDESEDDQDELALTRFPSGAAKAARPPPLVPSDQDSDEEDDPPSPPPLSEDELRKVVKGGNGDELLVSLYKSIKGCPCHGQTNTAPDVQQMWEIPGQADKVGPSVAVAEVAAPIAVTA